MVDRSAGHTGGYSDGTGMGGYGTSASASSGGGRDSICLETRREGNAVLGGTGIGRETLEKQASVRIYITT
jgi:hypothetical protein